MNNKEVRKLLLTNFVCIVVFIIGSVLISNNIYNKFKTEQINNNSYIVGSLIKKYPELESDIISSIILGENYELGYFTLERYGLTEIDDDIINTMDIIGKRRGCLIKGGEIDYDKVINVINTNGVAVSLIILLFFSLLLRKVL